MKEKLIIFIKGSRLHETQNNESNKIELLSRCYYRRYCKQQLIQIFDLKQKIQNQNGIKIEHQKIYVKGKLTLNEQKIGELSLTQNQTIVLYDQTPSAIKQTQKNSIYHPSLQKSREKRDDNEKITNKYTQTQENFYQEKKNSLNLQQKVKDMMVMGFEKEICIEALKSTNFDLNRAQAMLIEDISIEEDSRKVFSESQEKLRNKLMQIESFAMIREMIRKDKSVKNTIIKQFFGTSPKLYQMILKYPETFQKIISEDAPQPKIGLSIDDKKFVKNMMEFGYEKKNVIKAYLLYEKDQTDTLNFLLKKYGSNNIKKKEHDSSKKEGKNMKEIKQCENSEVEENTKK